MLGATLPTVGRTTRPVIDYLGAATLAAAVSAIVLVASLGGTTWPWGSPQVVVVAALGILLLGVFLVVERRAAEPVLPFAVMRDAVFRVAFSLSMVVGFALFGAVTFLPLFFQTVYEASPTGSGLRLIPLMGGLVFTSILSGRLISRFGRYKIFPVLGTAIMAVGLLLLSTLHVDTSTAQVDGYLLVLGLGLGLVMQVLVLAVQNAVDFSVLGAATSGVTLSRGIGGSLGTAVFGTIFSTGLIASLHDLLGATRSAVPRRRARRRRRAARARRAALGRAGRPAAGRGAQRLSACLRAGAAPGLPRRRRGRRRWVPVEPASCASARCARPPRPPRVWSARSPRPATETRWPRSTARCRCSSDASAAVSSTCTWPNAPVST